MKKLIAIALLLLPLVGCGEGELDYLKLSPIGGGGSAPAPAPAQPARGYNGQPLAPGESKMLQDPEATESNGSDYVWADSKEAARNLCQQTADRNGWRLDDVDDGEGIALQTGRKRYTCYFTMFGAPRQ